MSKLDYLKKYLAKPGEAEAAHASSNVKEKKKRKKGEAHTIQIRDLSEVLPAARETSSSTQQGSKLLSLGILDADEERLARDGELEFVEEDAVVEAQKKIDVEKSGVKWKISNHRAQPPKKALRAPATAGQAKVLKEEDRGEDDADLSPPRHARKSSSQDPASQSAAELFPAADGYESDLSPPRGIQASAKAGAAAGSDDDLSPPRAAPRKSADSGQDSDLSPPRQATSPPRRGAAAAGAVTARQRHDSDSDLSPPRQVKLDPVGDDDLSPPRNDKGRPAAKSKQDAAADLSPPRRPTAAKANPSKRLRHDSDADLSPPRKTAAKANPSKRLRHDSDADLSPPRKKPEASVKEEKDSDADLSPPRRNGHTQRKRHDSDADLSPPRKPAKPQRHDSDADLSPPRKPAKPQRHDSDADLSPPRKPPVKLQRHDSDADLSPPRQPAESLRRRNDSDADLSPPRKPAKSKHQRHDSDADLSPPRRGAAAQAEGDKKSKGDDDAERMSSGLRAGLVSGEQLKNEAREVREKRRAEIEAAPDSQTGKGADTIYRNRQGQRVTREEWVEGQQKKRKKRASEYPEQELEWGGGLKQRANKEEEMEELSRIAAQPFARWEMDQEAVDELQEKQAWNDPMRNFKDDGTIKDEGASSAKTAAAEEAQKKRPKCPHAPWNNRFGILPGYRWDGKVRGNDYEKRWLQAKNGRELQKNERYKWEASFD